MNMAALTVSGAQPVFTPVTRPTPWRRGPILRSEYRGGIFAFSDATFLARRGTMTLNQPFFGMAPTA